ncbi:UDP-N-acetylmuramoyl-tripeptide--D-alanyl-D-alanine ligase [Aquibacillus koreensis]|uniref:UDP-N-acetylmuramoyl-tripeptide--D-alanyl-D-alanine ligase n=1 Tax=Aquibacillus koreensis TaxID=279446 RepID=A0A9X3WNK8_9BACI|nr:UDP-N-acetylmuramoyl-tripeptide--D-alanyl-D-alanine ligase [Aquibacillus koreensis]MCT2538061.1 UDP-N-acetylmuramoyl-tripeptide--D-alanyl-D-alanine ligase [Aquibacillus koreensis]MDC3420584.1 UDP-N-acetylmuramoyl-tripeptide--D-alanyl-D-alanine ligase [Aquibacillus koreensis]
MLFTTNFLTQVFPNTKGVVNDSLPIKEVTTDSRKKGDKSLFIPLKGENFDGHDFIKDAFNNGAVATIWERNKELPAFLPTDFPVYYVEDSLQALQALAHEYRKVVNPIVIGVTGSNGKTTTKDLIGTVMQTTYKTFRTKGNFNNHIGLPLTILSMEADTEVLVLEMGMNHFGEIELLSNIAKPDYAVITNIGESHIEYLGSRQGIAQAKLEIMAGLKKGGLLFIDGDEPLLDNLHDKENIKTIGFKDGNDHVIKDFDMTVSSSLFTLNDTPFRLQMLGKHNVKNASMAIEIAIRLQVPIEKIKRSLVNLELTGMRFEIIQGINGVTIINDAYNASPTSMKASIEIVKQMQSYQRKVLILGDMFEMGEHSKRLHRTVAEAITDEVDYVFTIGQDSKEITDELAKQQLQVHGQHFTSKEALVNEIQAFLDKGTVILLKASRGMKFESLIEQLVD